MKTLIPLLCLTSATLFANIEFSSNEVDAHESEVVLKGNVLIKHPLGTLAAREATLFQEVANQDNSTFLSASLRSGVELQFTSQQPLHCEAATIDFVHNQASLSKVSVGQDQIKADSASLEMEKETLILYKPIGKIASNLINLTRPDEICFSSNILNWDRKTGELSLKENILVELVISIAEWYQTGFMFQYMMVKQKY